MSPPPSDPERHTGALARREIGVLLPLGLAAAGLLAFAVLADQVLEQDMQDLDMAVLLALRGAEPGDLIGPPWLHEAARDFTSFGGNAMVVLIAIVAALFLALTRRAWTALYLLACLWGGALLSGATKALIDRPRPDEAFQAVPVFSASFPSGHTLIAAVAYLTLGALLARVQERRRTKIFVMLVAVAITILVGITRVYFGVHWATDVLAGWALGAAWAALCWCGLLLIQRRAAARGAAEAPPGQAS